MLLDEVYHLVIKLLDEENEDFQVGELVRMCRWLDRGMIQLAQMPDNDKYKFIWQNKSELMSKVCRLLHKKNVVLDSEINFLILVNMQGGLMV